MRTNILAWITAIALATGSVCVAQDDSDLFTKLDANKDGFVSTDEVPEQHKGLFERLLRKAGKEEEKKLNKPMFQAALKTEDTDRQSATTRPAPMPGQGVPSPRELEALFERADANNDGKLSKDEVPPERPMIRRVFEQTGSESVSKDQFLQAIESFTQAFGRQPGGPERRPPGAPDRRPPGGPGGMPQPGLFAVLDSDRDGQLSTSEIVGAGTALLKLDRNGDGRLTPDEAFVGPPGGPFMRRPGDPRPPDGRPSDRPGERRPGDRGPGDRGPGDRGPGDRGPGDRGPGDRGPGDRGPSERRPGDPGAGERRPGDPSPEAIRERLKQADTNADGKLSKDEAPERLKENFDRIDANGDGLLDETELRPVFQRRGAPERERRPDRAPERP
jgi:Ca2+-binding EF-hand superfamily protein